MSDKTQARTLPKYAKGDWVYVIFGHKSMDGSNGPTVAMGKVLRRTTRVIKVPLGEGANAPYMRIRQPAYRVSILVSSKNGKQETNTLLFSGRDLFASEDEAMQEWKKRAAEWRRKWPRAVWRELRADSKPNVN